MPGEPEIPTATVRTAWRACPKGTAAMLIRDRLAEVFRDEDFADLYPRDGRPALSPAQLALVTVLQFAEHLSDRLAAEAVRTPFLTSGNARGPPSVRHDQSSC
jgi:transposase